MSSAQPENDGMPVDGYDMASLGFQATGLEVFGSGEVEPPETLDRSGRVSVNGVVALGSSQAVKEGTRIVHPILARVVQEHVTTDGSVRGTDAQQTLKGPL